MKPVLKKEDFIRMGLNKETIRYLEDNRAEAKMLGKAFVAFEVEETDDIQQLIGMQEWKLDRLAVAHEGEPKKYIMRIRVNELNYGTFLIVSEDNVHKLGLKDDMFATIQKSWIRGLLEKII